MFAEQVQVRAAATGERWWRRAVPGRVLRARRREVVAYVPVAIPVPAAVGRAGMFQVPAAELALAVHHGTLADVDQTYGALGIYVAEREMGVDGPIREHYLVTPFDTDDESELVTEVCWPVSPTTPAG